MDTEAALRSSPIHIILRRQQILRAHEIRRVPLLTAPGLDGKGTEHMPEKIVIALGGNALQSKNSAPTAEGQLEVVRQAQFCIGRDASCGSVWQGVRRAVTIFSIMVTWALENAIETADSMKSRGYGLRGRTAFSIYRMESRDRYALAWLGFCGLYLLCGCLAGGLKWWYFPLLQGVMTQPFSISFYLAYLALCLTPVIIDRREARAWRCSPSKT